RPRPLRSDSGFMDRRWMMLIFISVLAGSVIFYYYSSNRNADRCLENLKQIYLAIGLYEFDTGLLPNLSFYPDRPKEDATSLRVVLEKYGATGKSYLCPSSHGLVRDTGLSYVWNVALNGRTLKEFKDPVWMLVEVNAVSEEVPPPHLGRYHILYTDGQVALSDRPPSDIGDWLP
ncbi:MAG: hypothetical protein AAF492_13915, partial [Verrucomicrobiota bacterium]